MPTTIFIIDDSQTVRQIVEKALQREGVSFRANANGTDISR